MVCDCLVELSHVFFDKTFTYLIPTELQKDIKIGMRVKVPFGKQTLEAFVMSIYHSKEDIELKEIISLVDSYPVLNEELIQLGKVLQRMTMASLMSCYQVMLPKALKAKNKTNIGIKFDKYVRLNDKIDLNPVIEILSSSKNNMRKVIAIFFFKNCFTRS